MKIHIAILLAAISAGGSQAVPLNYTFNAPNPTGSFVYDSQLALGSQFSSFSVTLAGFTWDVTSTANFGPTWDGAAPDPCGTTVNSASSFALLTGTLCGGAGSTTWSVSQLFTNVTLTLTIQSGGEQRLLQLSQNSGQGNGPLFPTNLGGGQFSVTGPSGGGNPVPEPSTWLMACCGGAWVAARRFRARRPARVAP